MPNHSTAPSRETARPPRRSGTAALLLAAVLAATGLALPACAGSQGPGRLTGPVPADPDALLAELRAHKEKVDQATQDMMQRVELFNTSRQPGDRTIQFSEIFSEDLDETQRNLLNQLMAEEKDVSYKALLGQIAADVERIRVLQDRVTQLEQTLPDSNVVAQAGDTHNDLAMQFLRTTAGLDETKAKEVLAQSDRSDELVPGNKVWFSYDAKQETFRTYVTRGDAPTIPLALRRAKARELMGERDKALATVSELEQIRTGLEGDISTLQARRDALETQTARLQTDLAMVSGALASQQNSVFYHVAHMRELKDQKVLSPVLKRVRDVKGVNFDAALDLREATQITLYPGRFGVTKIDEVRLLPPIYQEGRDFRVEMQEDSGTATVTILDSNLFRGKEILLAIGG
jgi:cell division protein FtsB